MPLNRAVSAAVSRRKACGQEFSRGWLNSNVVERGGTDDGNYRLRTKPIYTEGSRLLLSLKQPRSTLGVKDGLGPWTELADLS